MNFNFMLAGSASTNPVLFVLAILIVLAWKVSGYYGLDYALLPALGVPWENRGLFGRGRDQAQHGGASDGRRPVTGQITHTMSYLSECSVEAIRRSAASQASSIPPSYRPDRVSIRMR